MPSMTMLIVLPGFIDPTPTDVPQAMTSPGFERQVARNEAHQSGRREYGVRHRIVLPLLIVQNRPDDKRCRIDVGGNHRTEHAERVEALGARPLREARILVEDVGGGDIVDARVAEDVAGRIGFVYGAAALADHDAKLAFEHDLAGVRLRGPNRLAAGKKRIVGFQESKAARLGTA